MRFLNALPPLADYYKDIFVQLGLLPEFQAMDVERFTPTPKILVWGFTGWVKLRNILAHEYLDLKWRKVHGFVEDSSKHFREFLESAKKFLK